MSKTDWPSSVQERYQKRIDAEMSEGSKTLCLLAVLLFPPFTFVDYYTQNQFFFELSVIRYATSLIYLFIFIFLRKTLLVRHPMWSTMFMLVLASASISVMCVITGGVSSRYYAGINLVILGAVLTFPGGPQKILVAVVLIISTYVLGVFWQGNPSERPIYLINNLSFLFSTAIIGIGASILTERLRRQSFLRFEELAKTKSLLQGELLGQQGNIESLTRQLIEKRTEAQEALKLREEFISLASHELKTPFTSLKLQMEISKRKFEAKGPEEFDPRRLLETYETQLKRLSRMIDDMLDISRIKKGKLELEVGPVNLTNLVENLLNGLREKFADEGIEIRLEALGPVQGNWDAYRIEQVILNLLNNAAKYGQGRPIEVRVYKERDRGIVEVRDFGIGIPEESQEKIFQRFERAVSARKFSGLGLGLYISKMIIEAHGGSISLTSKPGEGSTFTVELPLANEEVGS